MKKNEPTRQIEEIFKKFYDPDERDKRKILERREKRALEIKKDLGL